MRWTFDNTLAFVQGAHGSQMYGDKMYWTHCLSVAYETLDLAYPGQDMPSTLPDIIIAAFMHDVVEDTNHTIESLRELGVPEGALEIINLMSKPKGSSYEDYVQNLIDSENVQAMVVKLADNKVNWRGDKSDMPRERRDRLLKKYGWSIIALSNALEEEDMHNAR